MKVSVDALVWEALVLVYGCLRTATHISTKPPQCAAKLLPATENGTLANVYDTHSVSSHLVSLVVCICTQEHDFTYKVQTHASH